MIIKAINSHWIYGVYIFENGDSLVVEVMSCGESFFIGYENGYHECVSDSLVARIFDKEGDVKNWFSVCLEGNEDPDEDDYTTALLSLAKQIDDQSDIENASYIVKH